MSAAAGKCQLHLTRNLSVGGKIRSPKAAASRSLYTCRHGPHEEGQSNDARASVAVLEQPARPTQVYFRLLTS